MTRWVGKSVGRSVRNIVDLLMGFVSAHNAKFQADFGHSFELDIVKKASLNIPNPETCFFLKVVRQDQKYVRLDGIFRSSIWILLKRRRERLLLYNFVF